jgi:CubicO group peptidase (beta-lactamase class C family)
MGTPESVGMSAERLARIRPAVEKHIGEDRIAGAVTLVARRGQVVHLDAVGLMDREHGKPMQTDTIFRLYSMTKPVTCVALMALYEKGRFQLTDPVAKFIPAFADLKVYAGGDRASMELADLARPVTIRDLMTHTSGLTYHWLEYGPVEEMYRELDMWSNALLPEFVAALAELPLAFQPGTAWRYSVAHDVVAYLIEILSDRPLDAYLRETLFEPLGMVDTGFCVREGELDRFAAMYGSLRIEESDSTAMQWFARAAAGVNECLARPEESREAAPHSVFRGGNGLVSTAADYTRFAQMLLGNGELEGTRILSRKTVELMTTNHLPPNLMPYELQGMYSPGRGYGLGVEVIMDVGQSQIVGSVGAYSWSGAASTYFWVDPQEELIGIQMAQFQPGGFHAIANDFRVAAYQAIVD